MKNTHVIAIMICVLSLSLLQTQTGLAQMEMKMEKHNAINKAVCVVYPTQGNNVSGVITFTVVEGGVKVVAEIHGLTPGKHGFHIHEYGDCSSNDGTSAGGHYNPSGHPHGAPMDAMRHMGDMGNLNADASGNAHLEYIDKTLQLDGPDSIIGRGFIIHAGEDDLKTQPTGNAGARVACGVIGVAK